MTACSRGFLVQNMGEQFARSIGDALLNGDGDKKPDGLLSYTTTDKADGVRDWFKLQHINTEVAGSFGGTGNAGAEKLIELAYALRAPYRPNARWMMSRATASVMAAQSAQMHRLTFAQLVAMVARIDRSRDSARATRAATAGQMNAALDQIDAQLCCMWAMVEAELERRMGGIELLNAIRFQYRVGSLVRTSAIQTFGEMICHDQGHRLQRPD